MTTALLEAPRTQRTVEDIWRESGIDEVEARDELDDFLPAPKHDIPSIWEWPDNDDGRGAFLLAHHADILKFVPELKQWRVWHGHRWHPDTTGRVAWLCQCLSRHQLAAAKVAGRELSRKMAQQIDEGDTPKTEKITRAMVEEFQRAATARAKSLGSDRNIVTLSNCAQRDPRVIAPLARWDAQTMLVGVRNGVLDLRTGLQAPGEPAQLMTKTLAVDFDAAAAAPEWGKFINRILPGEVGDYVQKVAGYSLTGRTDDQAFYFCHGCGKNGKSVFVEAMASLFGDYGGKARRNLVEDTGNGKEPANDIAMLPGVRFLHGEETSEGGKFREDVIKGLTAGDTMKGEFKYGHPFDFIPCAKLWLAGNHKPRVRGNDEGIWRRVRLIPFEVIITEEEQRPFAELMSTFKKEGSGILNWLIAGLKACPSGSIPMPACIREAVAEYRESEDVLADFIEECVQDAAPNYKEDKAAIYEAYRKHAQDTGTRFPLSKTALTQFLLKRPGWGLDYSKKKWVGKSVRRDAA